MSRKRKHYVIKSINKSRPEVLDLKSLEKGILMSVTVNSRTLTAYREITEIFKSCLFNDGCDNRDNGLKPMKDGNNNGETSLQKNAELSLTSQIELESLILQQEANRFKLIDNISRCLVIIKFNNKEDVPSLMVEKLMERVHDHSLKNNVELINSDNNTSNGGERHNEKVEQEIIPNCSFEIPLSSRFVSRLLPLDVISSAKIGDIKNNGMVLIRHHFKYAYCLDESQFKLNDSNDFATNTASASTVSWACFYSSRYGGAEIKKQEIYDLFTELIWGPENDDHYLSRKKMYPVNLEKPSKAIIVEIIRSICGMSILNNYNKYFRYNLNRLLNQ